MTSINTRKKAAARFIAGLVFTVCTGAVDVRCAETLALAMPPPGSHYLHILSPDLLELSYINTKPPDPSRVPTWNFFDPTGQLRLPTPEAVLITVGAQPVTATVVGFKRRALYAPLRQRDLRIGNCLYLKLGTPLAEGQTVEVRNLTATSWPTNLIFTATMDPLRDNPAIHVNQVGYVPSFPKKAMVGYYLGSLGEMDITAATFSIVDASSGAQVFSGTLTLRK